MRMNTGLLHYYLPQKVVIDQLVRRMSSAPQKFPLPNGHGSDFMRIY
jgi:hypothetical protein